MVIQMNKVSGGVGVSSIPINSLGHTTIPLTLPESMLVKARDPYDVNHQIQANWNNVVGEPEGLRSPDWAWKFSGEVFAFVQAATYRFLVVLLAPLLSLLAALHFGILYFLHVWFFTPLLKLLNGIFSLIRLFIEIVLNSTFGPFVEMLGLLCSRVKVKHQRVFDAKDEPNYPFII